MNIRSVFLSIIGVSLLSTAALADQRLEQRVVRKGERLVNILKRDAQYMSRGELRSVLSHLNSAIDIVRGDQGGGPGGGAFYAGTCHIDDDVDFDFGQNIVGQVDGSRIRVLFEECQALAEAAYGSNSSSGIKDLKVVARRIPDFFQSAVCHIDDDVDFDAGQNVVGTLYAETVDELIADCKTVASFTYKENGSSGLKKLNEGRSAPRGIQKSAECWLDDDVSFDSGQIRAGIVWGRSTRDLIRQCSALAEHAYGANGSSGLANVR